MRSATFTEGREAEVRADHDAVAIRAALPEDNEAVRRMYARLSAQSIYLRFHTSFPEVPEWLLHHVMEVSRRDGGSLVAVVDGGVVGHAVYARSEDRHEAETAIVVEDRWQSKGIGRLLLSWLADAARLDDIEVFTGEVLGENRRMRGLAASLFPETRFTIKGGMYSVRMPLRASEVANAALPDRDAA